MEALKLESPAIQSAKRRLQTIVQMELNDLNRDEASTLAAWISSYGKDYAQELGGEPALSRGEAVCDEFSEADLAPYFPEMGGES